MKISVIGAGAWGTSISKILSDKYFEVKIWALESEVRDDINNNHKNSRYLKGIKLSENLVSSIDLIDIICNADYIFIAVPSLYILKILKEICNFALQSKPKIAILTKGFLNIDGKIKTLIEASETILPAYKDEFVYIAGPSHAEEVGLGVYTGLVAASKNYKNASEFIDLFKNTTISMFYSDDVLGVQLVSALKNIFAIAFGILGEYKKFNPNFIGNNTESFLFSVALKDMKNIAFDFGAKNFETFIFLAGVGDLDVTCRSFFSRNRRFGRDILSKNILKNFKGIDDIIKNVSKLGYFPEGLVATKEAYLLIKTNNKKPNSYNLVSLIYKIINKELKPEALIDYFRYYSSN